MIQMKDKSVFIYGLIILVILSRLIPHPANFTPIGALGLFAGAYIVDRRVWLVPLCALLLSDFFIGFYEPVAMLFVYLGFTLSVFIGRLVLSEKRTAFRLGGAVITSATLFFIVSNFGTWLTGMLYPITLTGLIECYVLAIPFYGNTLLGDVFYAVVLFGIFEAMQVWMQKQHITQAAQ